MATSTGFGFYIAPFGIDGVQVGMGFYTVSMLSNAWSGICLEFLKEYGAAFDASWGGKLSHIRTKFTSASGAALATFFVNGDVAGSILLSSGQSPETEIDVAEMFVDSLNRIILSHTCPTNLNMFSKITSMKERPLMVVVAWPNSSISDQDHDLVRELSLHLAGAFFSGKSDE